MTWDYSQFLDPWTVARQAPLSVGFSSHNTGVRFHALLQGTFLAQGLALSLSRLLHWQAGSLPVVLPGKPVMGAVSGKSVLEALVIDFQ